MINHSCPLLDVDDIEYLKKNIESNFISRGKITSYLENDISNRFLNNITLAVPSASFAIFLILKYRFPHGNANVLMSSYLCRSIWDAVKMANCIPVLNDIDYKTLSISQNIHPKIDIVIVAHMFGIKADYSFYKGLGLEVIEDCAQRLIPSFSYEMFDSDWKVYSFEPTKILASSNGGLIASKNIKNLEDIRLMIDGEYTLGVDKLIAPFSDIQASMMITQLNKLDNFLLRRNQISKHYTLMLNANNLGHNIHSSMLLDTTWIFRYILEVDNPELLIEKMYQHNIICRKPVKPFGLHTLFDKKGDFKNTEIAMSRLVSIPLYPNLKNNEIEYLVTTLIKCL